jgi:hypothetical protein
MQIQELLKLIEWVEKNVKKNQIPQKYTNLISGMTQNVNARNNQPKQSFDTHREALVTSLPLVSFENLTIEQIKLLEKFEIKNALGTRAVEIIDDILYRKGMDIASAVQDITEISKKINSSVLKLDEIEKSLIGVVDASDETEVPKDSVFMRIYFSGDSSITDVTELKRLAGVWYDIGRGVAIANNQSPEDFKIIGASKGSVVLELVVIAGMATSISTILLAGLKVTEKVLDILKKVEELKAMKLGDKEIVSGLKKEAENTRVEGIKKITTEITTKLKIKEDGESDKIIALEKSVKNIIEFTEKGGAIDFIQPEDLDEESEGVNKELREFRENCTKIRLLEEKIKLLEEKNKSK